MSTATATRGTRRTDKYADETRALLDAIFGGIEPRDFAVRLWDGSTWGPGEDQSALRGTPDAVAGRWREAAGAGGR